VVAFLLTLPSGLSAQTVEVPLEAVVIEYAGHRITRAEFERLSGIVSADPTLASPQTVTRGGLAEALVLAQEARRRGVDKDPGVIAYLEMRATQYLGFVLFQRLLDEVKKDEAAVRMYFETRPSIYETRNARQILVRFQGSKTPLKAGQRNITEQEAKAKIEKIRARIAGGADFAAIAKAESDDTKTAPRGGAMGTVQRGQTVAGFEETLMKTPLGMLSQPFKTEYGYHLIKVEKINPPEFGAVRKVLEYELAQKKLREIVASAKLHEAYFKRP
jgi:hypothetical protein